MIYEPYLKVIDDNADAFIDVSDYIFDHPELAFGEYKSARYLINALKKFGFTVTEGLAGIPTAFKAVYGEGRPAIGVLAEFDALHQLNYKACAAEPIKLTNSENGHGCGHNLFAGGSLAAAVALKKFVEDTGKGSVTLFGCPGEENAGGKVYMARDHVFDGMDAIVSWHPEQMHMPRTRGSLANYKVEYGFKGIAAHAGSSPQFGRSALDAVELMSVGVNYLREHMDPTSRIHYAYLDAGGEAPNIVQDHARVSYMIRAVDNAEVINLFNRVTKIAQGAALMTETEMTYDVYGAYSKLITIPSMQQAGYEVMTSIPVPVPNEEDIELGKKLRETLTLTDEQKAMPLYPDAVRVPDPPKAHGGSTDTSDVSWNCPTLQFHIATRITGTKGHSWQATSQGKTHFAHEAMLYAGKVLTGTAIRLMTEPELLAKAKEEHKAQIGSGYQCPLPPECMPRILPEE